MSNWPEELERLMALERCEDHFFCRVGPGLSPSHLFGGQILGQALLAASRTVTQEFKACSFHGNFISRGDASKPVAYRVERTLDEGHSIRSVTALQDERPVFICSALFKIETKSTTCDAPSLSIPTPESMVFKTSASPNFANHPIEFIKLWDETEPRKTAKRRLWFRLAANLPNDPTLHRCLLAYCSDFSLINACLLPHRKESERFSPQIASLDHAMWFHREANVTDWLLYEMDSPWAGGARDFNRGQIFDRDGYLVASCAQEHLTRPV